MPVAESYLRDFCSSMYSDNFKGIGAPFSIERCTAF